MGHTATVIAVSYTVVCVVAIGFMVAVVVSTRGRRPEKSVDVRKLRAMEKNWFVAVVVILVSLLMATIFFTPYGVTAAKGAQVVKIRAVQFAWLIPPTTFKVGRQVEFELTSLDVNHSFAVYSPRGVLLFQVQVMPDHWQDYVYTFPKPGVYEVVCLEYCGVGHDLMRAFITVTA
jgi:cytochrome c oxidase subunit 2